MAKKVAQQMMMCNSCGRKTLHQKNTKEISWLMHLVLTIFTASGVVSNKESKLDGYMSIWVLILMWHAIAKPASAVVNRWVCSQCGD